MQNEHWTYILLTTMYFTQNMLIVMYNRSNINRYMQKTSTDRPTDRQTDWCLTDRMIHSFLHSLTDWLIYIYLFIFVEEPASPEGEYLQYDLGEPRYVYGVVTRGRADFGQWVEEFYVSYTNKTANWTNYTNLIGDTEVSGFFFFCSLPFILSFFQRGKLKFILSS